jgi:hypothetical protein
MPSTIWSVTQVLRVGRQVVLDGHDAARHADPGAAAAPTVSAAGALPRAKSSVIKVGVPYVRALEAGRIASQNAGPPGVAAFLLAVDGRALVAVIRRLPVPH